MANKTLFNTRAPRLAKPVPDARNHEGAPAYALGPKAALAQLATTGCLSATFYAGADEQLEAALLLALDVDPEFVAKAALYARRAGRMKDMPALLCAVLASVKPALLEKVFDRVIDDARLLRTFVQVLRSGHAGRRSFGSLPKRLVRKRLAAFSDAQLLRASVGADPSLADIVRMVHPKPGSAARSAFYAWLLGKPFDEAALPEPARALAAWVREGAKGVLPDAPMLLLTSHELSKEAWRAIALRASWQETRMSLNTFLRHGVFEDASLAALVAARLRSPKAVEAARALPFQLLAAFRAAAPELPADVKAALEDAAEVATRNVPEVPGAVFVCPDVSGSMSSAVTGARKGATSAVRCIDVAALMAASLVRRNPATQVLAFDTAVRSFTVEPGERLLRSAQRLASFGGGGTSVSAPLAFLGARKAKVDLVVIVSDNESWVDARKGPQATATMACWAEIRRRNPAAKLVCIDIQPTVTTQAAESKDVLNVGGFSDEVFGVVAAFARGGEAKSFVETIEAEVI